MIGLAVSGGPDSMAMLLLAQAAFPGRIAAATVDHRLRPESAAEAALVASLCQKLGIAHAILPVEVAPGNLQDQARAARYHALAGWAQANGCRAVLTAHHADDQAETLLMRLNRGSGLAGLAGVRARGTIGSGAEQVALLRPLLGWRRAELAGIVAAAGIAVVRDPANSDPRFDRARIRAALAAADWLDPAALAQSAAHLAEADELVAALVRREREQQVRRVGRALVYRPLAPRIVRRRVVELLLVELGGDVRGGAVARLVESLEAGSGGNLGGVLVRPLGDAWRFEPEPPRGRH